MDELIEGKFFHASCWVNIYKSVREWCDADYIYLNMQKLQKEQLLNLADRAIVSSSKGLKNMVIISMKFRLNRDYVVVRKGKSTNFQNQFPGKSS